MFKIILFTSIFNNFTHSDTFYKIINLNDTLYITADHGIYIVDTEKDSTIYKYTNSDSIPFYPYFSILTKERMLFVTSSDNLTYIDLQNNKKYFYPPLYLEGDTYRAIILRGDTVFIGGNKGLKAIVRNKTLKTEDDSIIFERKNYLPNDTIYSLNFKDDTLLIGTKKGLYKIKIDSLGLKFPSPHPGIEDGRINEILIKDKKIFVSSDSFLYLYPDSLITGFNYEITSMDVSGDTLFVGTKEGIYLFYNNQKEKKVDFVPKDLLKVKNKIYSVGYGVKVYTLNWVLLNFKNLYKELSSNYVSSVKKFKNYYIVSLRDGMDVFNQRFERKDRILRGWIRTLDTGRDIIIASKWCGLLYKMDSVFNVYDTFNLNFCMQYLKFIDDSTFFILKPAENSIEVRNLKGEVLGEIFNLGYATDIERKDNYYIVSNLDGDIYKINSDYSSYFLINVGFPIHDMMFFEDDLFLATNSGLLYYKFPDLNFVKNYKPFDPYTVSVTCDKYGNVYALTRSGVLFIDAEKRNIRILEPGVNSLINTDKVDFNTQCSASLLFYDEDNNLLLIGTNDGFSIMDLKDHIPETSIKRVLIFPNPFRKEKGYFYVKTDVNIKEIFIYSPSGIYKGLEFKKLSDRYKVITPGIKSGFYIVIISSDRGNFREKVICE